MCLKGITRGKIYDWVRKTQHVIKIYGIDSDSQGMATDIST